MTTATFDFDFEVPYANWYLEIGPPLLQLALAANNEEVRLLGCVDTIAVPGYNCPYVLLGREGFLNQWRACFRELYQRMYFALDGIP